MLKSFVAKIYFIPTEYTRKFIGESLNKAIEAAGWVEDDDNLNKDDICKVYDIFTGDRIA